jgi:hypothetical protein
LSTKEKSRAFLGRMLARESVVDIVSTGRELLRPVRLVYA